MGAAPRGAPGECLVTPDGVRVGRSWVSLQRGDDAHAGVLAREQEIRELLQRQARLEPRVGQLGEQLAAAAVIAGPATLATNASMVAMVAKRFVM